jgi:sortase B
MLKVLEKIKSLLLSIMVLVSVVFILIYVIGNRQNAELTDDLMTIHDMPTAEETSSIMLIDTYDGESAQPDEILESMQPLIERNSDTVGWVKVGDLVDNVVVQGEDNSYYLTKDFDNNYSEAGTVFLDQYCVINPSVKCNNIILYGHNQMNGSMFGSLTKFKKDPLLANDIPYIEFSNNYHNFKFKIVSMFIINTKEEQDDEPLFPYHMYSRFNDEYTYETFANEITRRSLVTSNIDFNENDTFITLSTCAVDFDEARFVIVGRAIRNEDDLNTTPVYEKNPDAYLPQIYYDLNCNLFQY